MTRSFILGAAISLALVVAANAQAGGFICGDGLIGPNEVCDDGNAVSGDGCSEFCTIENNYECRAPFVPTDGNVVVDGGFEESGIDWVGSTSSSGPILCDVENCPEGFFSRDGARWARFGSLQEPDESFLQQDVVIPEEHWFLEFDVGFPVCGSSKDELLVTLDDTLVRRLDGADNACGVQGYRTERIDLRNFGNGQFNDNGTHTLTFTSFTTTAPDFPTVFLIDNVRIVKQVGEPVPSLCELEDFTLDYQDFDPGVAGNLEELGLVTFELGDPVPWGTTDDGICGSGDIPLGNVTGGDGEAACLDASASGSNGILSLFCTSPINFETVLGSQLSFLLNLQLGQMTGNDFFTVLIGIDPPDPGTIFGYQVAFETFDNVG
ncbi:MAG: myxococcus cysteine-rich repeat containing protein, partial [Pseudomonadota bacterium]